MTELKLGDIVLLKSGSLPMTVTSLGGKMPNGGTKADCSYFDGNKIVTWSGVDLALKASTSSLTVSASEKLVRYRGLQNSSD